MARRINAPGTEVNEIDRSGYNQAVDNSTVGTTSLVLGFADKGDEYNVKWMNTMTTFVQTYGTPQTEAEKYFYNAVYEALSRNGVCYAAKLPYYNNSNEKYIYTSYTINDVLTPISSVAGVIGSCVCSNKQLSDCLFFPSRLGNSNTVKSAVQNISTYNSVYDFRQFVEETINADVEQQQLFETACYDLTHKNLFTSVLSVIMNYDGNQNSLKTEYTNKISNLTSEVSALKDDLVMAFETSSVFDVIDDFIETLYLNDVKSYYLDISS